MKAIKLTLSLLTFIATIVSAQITDSLSNDRFSIHAQTTVINQFKPAFKVMYSGDNSLSPDKENQTSLTSTLYMGARLWKGASIFINPEIAGGSGLSGAVGIAAATNGETFRIGDPAPKIYVARIFYRQLFALSKEVTYQSSGFNQLEAMIPTAYFAFTFGKIGVADYFDNNVYSHDPRSQFMSWALMDNGAWDYPANTRGYTTSLVLEYVTPKHEVRYGASMVPLTANGNELNKNILNASSHSLELTRRHVVYNKAGAIRLLAFFTTANMGNYKQSIALNPTYPEILNTRKYGNTKYGFAINAEQAVTKYAGCFFRAGWNDGNNETWAFTEIDHSVSAGLSFAGGKWKRSNDNLGIAYVASGLSKPHRNYLQAGGKGFILGDGNLNYTWEQLAEIYYSAALLKNTILLSGSYQMVINPGYNKDRQGPVHVFSIRLHVSI